jgi:heat shock protein HslJ
MKKTFVRRATTCFAALLAAAGAAVASDQPSLPGTGWVLSGLPGRTLVPGATATIRFEADRAHGTDGCNRYSSRVTVSAGAIHFDPSAASTQMACPQDVMDQASAFRGALLGANAWRMEGGQLQLLDGAAVLATFAPQAKALAGTSWRVTGYNNGRQAVVSVLQDTTLEFAFTNDGKVEGTAGCNRFTGTYASKGAALSFGPLAATRMMCAKPEKIMEQEQQFLAALGTVATARIEGDHLELRAGDGALAVSARKVSQ